MLALSISSSVLAYFINICAILTFQANKNSWATRVGFKLHLAKTKHFLNYPNTVPRSRRVFVRKSPPPRCQRQLPAQPAQPHQHMRSTPTHLPWTSISRTLLGIVSTTTLSFESTKISIKCCGQRKLIKFDGCTSETDETSAHVEALKIFQGLFCAFSLWPRQFCKYYWGIWRFFWQSDSCSGANLMSKFVSPRKSLKESQSASEQRHLWESNAQHPHSIPK